MALEDYDGWRVNLNSYFQTTDVRYDDPDINQIFNMNLVYDFFVVQKGWTPNAVAGMLGNMMVESTVNPWIFQHRIDWSDPAVILADNGGMGLTQWTPCSKYYQWALDENLDPKSGYTMCERIMYEYHNNLQWSLDNYGQHTWEDFVTSTEEPWILADVFLWAYERPLAPDEHQRWANAEWVFANIHGTSQELPLPVLLYMGTRKKGAKFRWVTI